MTLEEFLKKNNCIEYTLKVYTQLNGDICFYILNNNNNILSFIVKGNILIPDNIT